MKTTNETLIEIGYWSALVFLALNGVVVILAGFSILPFGLSGFLDAYSREFFTPWGILSILFSLYFVRLIINIQRAKARIMSPGPGGPIWISHEALRDFVMKTLEESLGLHEIHVSLQMDGEGVSVKVRTAVPLSHTITEWGEQIQECVKSQVEARIGVHVSNVEVYAKKITKEALPPSEREEYTPLDFPEHDKND